MNKKIKIALIAFGSVFALIVIALILTYVPFASVTEGEPIKNSQEIKSALVVIDIQEGLSGSESEFFLYKGYVKQSKEFITNVNKVIDTAVSKGISVVYIYHEDTNPVIKLLTGYSMVKGSTNTAIDKRVKVVSDNIFSKNIMDGFSNPKLHSFLMKNNINQLYVTGLDAQFCVYRTSLAALQRGYKVTIVKDGIISSTKPEKEKMIEKYKEKNINLLSVKNIVNKDNWNN